MEHTLKSILVRSKLTRDEWERFRILALRENEPTSHVVGRLMREHVEQNDPDGAVTRRRA